MAVKLPPYERFEDLPGVGTAVADDLRRMGYVAPADLRGLDPEDLYEQIEVLVGSDTTCSSTPWR